VRGEGLGQVARRDLQGRPVHSTGEGLNERPEGFQRVTRALAELGHPDAPRWLDVSARTCAEAAGALGVQVGQIAKSVIFRRRADGAAVLVVAAGDQRVDEHKVAARVGAIGRADAAFVKSQTGFSIGGVSPVAHAQPPVVLIDRELFRFGEVWAAAGHPNGVFRASPDQLVALTGAPVADVALEPPPAQRAAGA
jgi:prolyl-tRNA editing enzyme YbaK/EbsC (Cys-tRNA(Pro) deacylase)